MKAIENQIVLILLILAGCKGDECGNRLSVEGKYVNHSIENDMNYIILNRNGTYVYYYKQMGKNSKSFLGKWKKSVKNGECQITFNKWKDIVGYMKLDEISYNYAHHRNDKLMFFEDIDGAEYKKEK